MVLPEAKSIGDEAFYGCTKLSRIFIPDTIKSIGKRTFYGCKSLKYIDYTGTKAQWNAISKGSFWNNSVTNCKVYCVDGTMTM